VALTLTNANDIEPVESSKEELNQPSYSDQYTSQNTISPIQSLVQNFHLAQNRRK